MYLLRLVRLVVPRQLVEHRPRPPPAVVVIRRRFGVQNAVGLVALLVRAVVLAAAADAAEARAAAGEREGVEAGELLGGGDVLVGGEEEHDLPLLVLDGDDVEEAPERSSCKIRLGSAL